MKKILTVSRIYTANLGDVLLSRGLAELLMDEGYEVEQREFASSRSGFVRGIVRIFTRARLYSVAAFVIVVANFRVVAQRKSFSMIILGGGQLLLPRPQFVVACRAWVILSRLSRLPIVAFGVGTEQVDGAPKLRRSDLTAFSRIYVRDGESQTVLGEHYDIACQLTPDVAYGVTLNEGASTRRYEGPHVGLCVSGRVSILGYDRFLDFGQFLDELCCVLARLRPEGITLFSTVKSDYADIEEIWRCLAAKFANIKIEVAYIESLDELIALYARFDVVVGARMHSLILAQLVGIPAHPVFRNRKLISYNETFLKFGAAHQRRLLKRAVGEALEKTILSETSV